MSRSAEIMQPLPDIIEPRWWTGTQALPPESFTIDCTGYASSVQTPAQARETLGLNVPGHRQVGLAK